MADRTGSAPASPILLVVAARKYTGAAAVAEHCCRALRAAGADARLLFQRGRNLQERLHEASWALPALVKERSLADLRANVATVRGLARGAGVVVSHLPHDHFLCVLAGAHRRAQLVRSLRSIGHLRRDPLHRMLLGRAAAVVLAHSDMAARLASLGGPARSLVLPVPVDERFSLGPVTRREGQRWRQLLQAPPAGGVIGMVGKLARGRGFDLLLDAAARIRPPVQVVVVGHGEAQPILERRARRLGIDGRVHWVGYQEQALPGIYAALDVVVFTGLGSDHGHRAISEAQACGRVVAAVDQAGVRDLISDRQTGLIAGPSTADLAATIGWALERPAERQRIGTAAAAVVRERRLEPSGRRLYRFLLGR